MLGGMGMDPQRMMAMMANPGVQQMMNAMMSDPQSMAAMQQLMQQGMSTGSVDQAALMQHMNRMMANPKCSRR